MTDKGWRHDVPSWEEVNRAVEVAMRDGSLVQGRLAITDYMFDGEHEWPIWSIQLADGSKVSFDDHKRWRFMDDTTSERPGPGAA